MCMCENYSTETYSTTSGGSSCRCTRIVGCLCCNRESFTWFFRKDFGYLVKTGGNWEGGIRNVPMLDFIPHHFNKHFFLSSGDWLPTLSAILDPSAQLWPHDPKLGLCREKLQLHPKLRNINLHNINHSLISRNPREQTLVVQLSLLTVTFLSLISQFFVINASHQRSQPIPLHCAMCRYVECHLLLLLLSLVECWCMHMLRTSPRTVKWSGPHQLRWEGMNSNSIVSHATLFL